MTRTPIGPTRGGGLPSRSDCGVRDALVPRDHRGPCVGAGDPGAATQQQTETNTRGRILYIECIVYLQKYIFMFRIESLKWRKCEMVQMHGFMFSLGIKPQFFSLWMLIIDSAPKVGVVGKPLGCVSPHAVGSDCQGWRILGATGRLGSQWSS